VFDLSALMLVILTELFRGFPQYLQPMLAIVSRIKTDNSLPFASFTVYDSL
jgi:hypothetical protein